MQVSKPWEVWKIVMWWCDFFIRLWLVYVCHPFYSQFVKHMCCFNPIFFPCFEHFHVFLFWCDSFFFCRRFLLKAISSILGYGSFQKARWPRWPSFPEWHFVEGVSAVPIPSMYGIFTYIYHKNQPNVHKYTIHGFFGVGGFKHVSFLKFIFGEDDPNWLFFFQIGWNHQIRFMSIFITVLQCSKFITGWISDAKTEDIAFHSFGKVLPEELSMAVLKVRSSIFFGKNVGFNEMRIAAKNAGFLGMTPLFLGKLWWAVDGTDTGGDSSIFWVVFFYFDFEVSICFMDFSPTAIALWSSAIVTVSGQNCASGLSLDLFLSSFLFEKNFCYSGEKYSWFLVHCHAWKNTFHHNGNPMKLQRMTFF